MPAIGRVTIEENAARRGVAKTRGAGELLDLIILTAFVELIYSYSLIIDGHFNAVWDTLRNGVIREEERQRIIISLAGLW